MSFNSFVSSRRPGVDLVLETEVDDAMLSCAIVACITVFVVDCSSVLWRSVAEALALYGQSGEVLELVHSHTASEEVRPCITRY